MMVPTSTGANSCSAQTRAGFGGLVTAATQRFHEHVFAFLTAKEVCRCEAGCRAFRSASTPQLWSLLFRTARDEIEKREFQAWSAADKPDRRGASQLQAVLSRNSGTASNSSNFPENSARFFALCPQMQLQFSSRDLRLLSYTNEVCTVLDTDVKRWQGRTIELLVHPEDKALVLEGQRGVLAAQAAGRHATWFSAPRRPVRWFCSFDRFHMQISARGESDVHYVTLLPNTMLDAGTDGPSEARLFTATPAAFVAATAAAAAFKDQEESGDEGEDEKMANDDESDVESDEEDEQFITECTQIGRAHV